MNLLDVFDKIFGKPAYEDEDTAIYVLQPPPNTWHDKCVHLLDPNQCIICKKEAGDGGDTQDQSTEQPADESK